MQTLQEIISKELPQIKTLSAKVALANFSHIELTDEEHDTAILNAKIKKQKALDYQAQLERIEENRRNLTSTGWDFSQTKNFMLYRAEQLFNNKFILDEHNQIIFELLCRYYSDDKDFISVAQSIGIDNPSLHKGILLAGTFGTGKTWMMKLFQKNKKSCFILKNAKEIASEFQVDGQEAVENYTNTRKNAFNDASFFYQPVCGLCIDDLGTEEIKNNFGNKSNVLGDILEMRYAKNATGIYLHATTNMDAAGIKSFYGGRVVSRMREIFNIIELQGNDKRK